MWVVAENVVLAGVQISLLIYCIIVINETCVCLWLVFVVVRVIKVYDLIESKVCVPVRLFVCL
jgi:hypothetical protein